MCVIANRLKTASAAFVAVFVIGLSAQAQDAAFPLWWAEELSLQDDLAVEEALDQPLANPILMKRDGITGTQTETVYNCADYGFAWAKGFRAPAANSEAAAQAVMRCDLLTALGRGVAAREGGLRVEDRDDLVLSFDEKFALGIPAWLIRGENCTEDLALLKLSRDWWSYGRYFHAFRRDGASGDDGREERSIVFSDDEEEVSPGPDKLFVVQLSDNRMRLIGGGRDIILTLAALGDFNGEGFDQALMLVEDGVHSRLVTLERRGRAPVLDLASPDQLLSDIVERCPSIGPSILTRGCAE